MKQLTKEQKLRLGYKKDGGVKVKGFGSNQERRNYLEKLREKEKKKSLKPLNDAIEKTYGKWQPVKELRRSFFVWKGGYSGSHKEREIYAILKSHNLRFYCEVSFDLRKRFDFYIPLLDLVIEYDGVQHFSKIKDIRNDIEKESILKRLGIRLIRYNKTHKLKEQIAHDLIHHEVLKS